MEGRTCHYTLITRPFGWNKELYIYRCGLVEGVLHAVCWEISAYHTVKYARTDEKVCMILCTEQEYSKIKEIVISMGQHLCEFDVNVDEIC